MEQVQRLLREIELHHVELERQNEELRAAQRHLEAYRDRYIDLYDFAPLGYVTLDEDGFVQEINLAGAKLLDTDREELTGYAFAEYVAKESREAFLQHVAQCVGQRSEVTTELHLITRGGLSITAQLHSIPVAGPMDDTLCKTAITDITERRKMEEALRKSQVFLQTVIDAMPETMLVIGRDYQISLANRAARELAGGIDPVACLACHQLSHKRPHPCAGQSDCCPLRQVIATKAPVTVLHTHHDSEGREVFVEVTAAPVFDDCGEVTHIIESCRNVTDRKRAEAALEQDRNLLRALIDHLPDCIYIKDTQGRFIAANLATAQLMGATAPDDLLGKTDADFYPPELAAKYRADEEQLLRSGQSLLNQNESRADAAGHWRNVVTSKIPLLDSQGKVYGLVGITRDLSEHVKAMEAMRIAEDTPASPARAATR
jgi:PAS domain S-box-containing protein